ncbi:MAG: alpha-L-arabinofuranosidase C-terminal domain-containing protein [Verrucomicrobiota bacterium]
MAAAALKNQLSGHVLTAPEMNAHNTFDNPNAVALVEFSAFKSTADGFSATLPAKPVVLVAVKQN